jgi:hypothetical protein
MTLNILIYSSRSNEDIPAGLLITNVQDRFTCLFTLDNEKRVCKELDSFFILAKNTFDCHDRNVEIAFRGYKTNFEETGEFIESFLNSERGEVMSSQLREKECLFFKK